MIDTQSLRIRAEALAAAQLLAIDAGVSWHEAYEHLVECVENNEEPTKFEPWQPLEYLRLDGLLEHITGEADTIYQEFLAVAEEVSGIATN